jgi:hypothetical protein
MLKAVRDDYADTARKANKVTAMLSALYSWAQQGQLVPDGFNPAAGLKKLKRKGGAGNTCRGPTPNWTGISPLRRCMR